MKGIIVRVYSDFPSERESVWFDQFEAGSNLRER